jgi:hypothetical protein
MGDCFCWRCCRTITRNSESAAGEGRHRSQSLADRRAKMRSRLGLGLAYSNCSSRETYFESSIAALVTRLGRPRNFIFLIFIVCVGYLLVVSTSQNQPIIDNSNLLGLPELNTFLPEIIQVI